MNHSVMILGGYGNFGKRISLALVKSNIPIILVGRNKEKAMACADHIIKMYPSADIKIEIFDVKTDLSKYLALDKPTVVINTCGPFQGLDYSLIEMCIAHKTHYLDLADGRDFVVGITILDAIAKENNVTVIPGSSSVPGLTSAVIEHFKDQFSEITSLNYGISTAQKTATGLATASSILSYLGKPLKPYAGSNKTVYGWQGLYCQNYPIMGRRWMCRCDIPDLDLFPARYAIKDIQFSAGVESTPLHFCMWMVSWLIRLGLPINLSKHVKLIQHTTVLFNLFAKNQSGMHMIMTGKDKENKPKEVQWYIIAMAGEGLEIPTIPAIILARKLVQNQGIKPGAYPCVGLVTLEEYLQELSGFAIKAGVKSQLLECRHQTQKIHDKNQ